MKKIFILLFFVCLAVPIAVQAKGPYKNDKPEISEEQRSKIRDIFDKQGLKEKHKAVFSTKKAYTEAIVAGKDGAKEKSEALKAYETMLDTQKTIAEALTKEGLPTKILLRGMRKGHPGPHHHGMHGPRPHDMRPPHDMDEPHPID